MSRYTAEQIKRRQQSAWTLVQVIGAPIQLLVFIVSMGFVIYSMFSDDLFWVTNITILLKIFVLYFMFITGMFWEKDVFDHYYLSKEFFWEDVVSTVLLATHTAYLIALFAGASHTVLLVVILIAYLNYVINALQYFVRFLQNRQKNAAIRERENAISKA